MFRKFMAVLLTGLLLNPGCVFAQTNATPKSSLQDLQAKATRAYETLSEDIKRIFNFSDDNMKAESTLLLASVGAVFVESHEGEVLSGLGGLVKFIHEHDIRGASEAEIAQFNYLSDLLKSSLEGKWDAELIQGCMEADLLAKKHSYTKAEMKYIAEWLASLKAPLHQTMSTSQLLTMVYQQENRALLALPKGSKAHVRVSLAILRNAGIWGVALLLVLGTTAVYAKSPNDAKMTQRIMSRPDLFLTASAEDLQEIAQNSEAEELVRTYADGLIQLAEMSDEDKKAVMETAIKLDPQYRTQVDVTRSLRSVKAR